MEFNTSNYTLVIYLCRLYIKNCTMVHSILVGLGHYDIIFH